MNFEMSMALTKVMGSYMFESGQHRRQRLTAASASVHVFGALSPDG